MRAKKCAPNKHVFGAHSTRFFCAETKKTRRFFCSRVFFFRPREHANARKRERRVGRLGLHHFIRLFDHFLTIIIWPPFDRRWSNRRQLAREAAVPSGRVTALALVGGDRVRLYNNNNNNNYNNNNNNNNWEGFMAAGCEISNDDNNNWRKIFPSCQIFLMYLNDRKKYSIGALIYIYIYIYYMYILDER